MVLLPKLSASALRGITKSRRRRSVSTTEMTEAVAESGVAPRRARYTSMIGLDTNILVCYLTQDDPVHSLKVT